MSDLSEKEKAVLSPFMHFAYNEGYADGLEAAVQIVNMLGARPQLVIQSLRESAQDIRPKAHQNPANQFVANRPTPSASTSSSSENPCT